MRGAILPWIAAALGACGAWSVAAADPLFAEVTLNGAPTNGVVQFEQQGERLQARPTALRSLGLTMRASQNDDPVDLSSMPGLRYRLDSPNQAVEIVADPQLLATNSFRQDRGVYRRPDEAAWGAVVNYGAHVVSDDSGHLDAAAIGEVRVFGPHGVFSQGVAARQAQGGVDNGFRRLDTRFVIDDTEAARRLVIGDFISASLPWTPAVRAAGVSLTTDFTLRPDLVTQPLARVKGTAATPSTVELYVDGVRRFASRTAPGPFSVDMTPMMDGQGQVNVVVTDALGRQSVQNLPFYAASELLAPKTTAFALEAGWLRDGYASDDDRYTDAFATAVARRGLTDHVTAEGHLTMAGDLRTAGAGVVAKLGEAALFSVAFNASDSAAGQGGKVRLSARRQTGAYSLFMTLERSTPGFREASWRFGEGETRQALQLGGAVRTNQWGTVSASYNQFRTAHDDFSVAGVNWSREFGPVNLYANILTSKDKKSHTVFSLGFTAPLQRERSLSASASSSGGRSRFTTQVSSPPPAPYGWGWRASAETGGGAQTPTRLEAEVRRTSSLGELELGVARQDARTYAHAYGSGSLVLIGGRVRATAQVGDSFALIETGEPDVAISLENRPIGRTDRHGTLLAAQIPTGSTVRVAIDPESVALTREMPVPTLLIRPPRGMGIIARMPIRRSAGAIFQFIDPGGEPLPAGAQITLNGRGAGRTGFDGEAYLTDLSRKNIVLISSQSGECRLEADYAPQHDAIPRIGPLVCALGPPRDPFRRRPAYADNGGGAELYGSDGSASVRDLRSDGRAAGRLEQRLHRDEVHVQRSRLHSLWIQYRNPIRWFGRRGKPHDDPFRRNRDVAIRAPP